MKLTFLGSGSSFSTYETNFHSNMLLESQAQKYLLIDCGADARHSLKKAGFSASDIDAVYISHFHADHAGGLEWLAFSRYLNPGRPKPTLFIHPTMINTLWDRVLSGGLQSLAGETPATINTYFTVGPIINKHYFVWEDIKFEFVPVTHVFNANSLIPSYGLFFKLNNTQLFITTDTKFMPEEYKYFYESADIIFHDCETSKKVTSVHPRFEDLAKLSPEIKSKMWLYHYSDGPLPNAQARGFKGFVQRGQVFNFAP